MDMIQPMMPGQGESDQGPRQLSKLLSNEKVAIVQDNDLKEKIVQGICAPFSVLCFPRKYNITSALDNYKAGGDKMYSLEERGHCLCDSEWVLKNPAGEQLHVYNRPDLITLLCTRTCLGGAGLDVSVLQNDIKGEKIGSAYLPAWQCLTGGTEIRDSGTRKRFFVGDRFDFCGESRTPVAVWNEDETKIIRVNVHVMPWPRKLIPCLFCYADHWVVEFPDQAKSDERSELIASTIKTVTPI